MAAIKAEIVSARDAATPVYVRLNLLPAAFVDSGLLPFGSLPPLPHSTVCVCLSVCLSVGLFVRLYRLNLGNGKSHGKQTLRKDNKAWRT